MNTVFRRFVRPFLLSICFIWTIPSHAATYYVDISCTNSTPPYTNWIAAATNIQNALDVAQDSDTVLVSNGVYSMGWRYDPTTFNQTRIVITNEVLVQAMNGPSVTTIKGDQSYPGTRCAYVGSNAMLSGFTLTGALLHDHTSGGGVWCESSAQVTNCIISSNECYLGGAVFGGVIRDSTLVKNIAISGGGAYGSTLNDCLVKNNYAEEGGGSYEGILIGCTLSGNSASRDGGGSYHGILTDCHIIGNVATNEGGGVASGAMTNCIVEGNSSQFGGGGVP